jgi:hypothetical protein
MTPKYFVEILKKIVQEQAVNDIIENLEEPPGKKPSAELSELSYFYKSLNEEQKDKIKKILNETAEMTFFGLLCILDGVRAIESGEDKGTLELWYRKGEETILLNDPDDDFLHDLMI